MAFRKDLLLLLSRTLCFASTTAALIIYSGHSSSGRIRMRAFSYLIFTLMIQVSVCILELCGQLLSMWFGSTTPVSAHPTLCLLLIIADWLMAFLMVGAACSALGVLTFFMANHSFYRYVVIRAMCHCILSLMAGAFSLLSAYLSVEIAKSRRLGHSIRRHTCARVLVMHTRLDE